MYENLQLKFTSVEEAKGYQIAWSYYYQGAWVTLSNPTTVPDPGTALVTVPAPSKLKELSPGTNIRARVYSTMDSLISKEFLEVTFELPVLDLDPPAQGTFTVKSVDI